jgi:hypothetical protein
MLLVTNQNNQTAELPVTRDFSISLKLNPRVHLNLFPVYHQWKSLPVGHQDDLGIG